MRSFAIVLPIAFAVMLAAPSAAGAPLLRTTVGVVAAGAKEDNRIWFDLFQIDQRFAFDPRRLASAEAIFDALKDSNAKNKSVSIHFFVDGATFDVGTGKPAFLIHDLTYDGRTYPVEAALPEPDPNAVPLDRDIAAAALAKAIALAGDGDPAQAMHALAEALDSKALEPELRILALKTRSAVEEDHALAKSGPGPERDELLFASLTDARAWQALAPEDGAAAMEIARDLAYLGAYDEAIAQYLLIRGKWPELVFRSYVNTAAIYRRLGEYDKGLAELDALVKRDGPQTGMAYSYHRGWLLNKAGRYAEANTEFTAGLKDQPDYQGAFLQRACARARLGDLKGAIEDQKEAVKAFAAYGADTPLLPDTLADQRRAAEVEQILEKASAQNPGAKIDAPCTGYSDWGEEKRERSTLLPPPHA